MKSKDAPQGLCPVCNSKNITGLLELQQLPVHCNLLLKTRREALSVPKGDIKLGFCSNCDHIFNLTFNPELMAYDQSYENSLHFSSHFENYARSLAANLIKRYDLHNKDIIEIGCGKGEFLSLLCKLGDNRGIGFDVSYVPEKSEKLSAENITFVRDFYSNRYAHYKVNLLCCRHVLEHIHDPVNFLTQLRQTIGNRTNIAVFFEVPNVIFTLRDLGIWDIIYEHCSYFSSESLSYLFASCGFNVKELAEVFKGQFLSIEAIPGNRTGKHLTEHRGHTGQSARYAEEFSVNYRNIVTAWKHKLDKLKQRGKRAVVWGGGSKGVTFLSALKLEDQISYVVDINPRKHNMFVAGTGQQIVRPEFLKEYKPDTIIIMNPNYYEEIQNIVYHIGIEAELVSVLNFDLL